MATSIAKFNEIPLEEICPFCKGESRKFLWFLNCEFCSGNGTLLNENGKAILEVFKHRKDRQYVKMFRRKTLDQIDFEVKQNDDPMEVAVNFIEGMARIGIVAEVTKESPDAMTVRIHYPN